MAETATKPAVQSRADLEKTVKQQILLSISLKFEDKGNLIGKLPSLKDKQLTELKKVFDEEQSRKEKMLSDFFAKNPQLFPEFERFSQQHINSIYRGVEDEEKQAEVKRLEEILQAKF